MRGAPVRLPSAGASVTAPLGQEGGEPRPFLLVAAKGRFVTLAPDGSQPLVFRPAARVEARPAGLGFELEHAVHRPLQKRAVVRDAHDSAVEPADERLQAVEAIEIEIVRRLVQEQDIGPHEEGRREPNPSLLAAREPGERTSEIGAQPELGGRPGGPRFQVAAPDRDEGPERRVVRVGGRCVVRQAVGRRNEGSLRVRDACPARDIRPDRLAGERVGLLGNVRDGELGRGAPHRAGIGGLDTGEDPEQRRLADPVCADDSDAVARSDGERDAVDDDPGAVGLHDVVCGERSSHEASF